MPVAITSDSFAAQSTQLLDNIFTVAANSDDRRKAAGNLAAQLKMAGSHKVAKLGMIATLKNHCENKKTAGVREGAMLAIAALLETSGESVVPFCVPVLGAMLTGLGDKQKNAALAAEVCLAAFMKHISASAVKAILPEVLSAFAVEAHFKTKIGALRLLDQLAETAPTFIDKALPTIIPEVSQILWDSKPEVCEAAAHTLTVVCNTVSNPDLIPFIAVLVAAIKEPNNVPETVYKLSATTFVTTVEAPSLAIMAPILERGLNEKAPATQRCSAVIIDNMCKLVEDPTAVDQFLARLLPPLDRDIEVAADPELRSVATRARETLIRVCGGKEVLKAQKGNVLASVRKAADAMKQAEELVHEAIKAADQNMAHLVDQATISYVANLCASLDDIREYKEQMWSRFGMYFASYAHEMALLDSAIAEAEREAHVMERSAKIAGEIHSRFITMNNRRTGTDSSNDADPEEGEELCNCTFSLAYGGMILLNNTAFRLTRGQRYGLCGPNGVGKSTLMRAISNGQLEGFPAPDVLKTVFVEHNLQASDAEKAVLEFITSDDIFKGVDPKHIKDTLASVGFDEEKQVQSVSALSGGWKMKLELARAMLMQADILLLDEPTNHLDVKNVKWLTDYLRGLKNVTSIIVSHDSGFLDDVCSHIVHYENRKLKTYKGNLSAFVKVVPEAKSYYELATSRFEFKFPEPGFLDGVKSTDKAILKMSGVGYQYPGTPKMMVSNINVQVSLNSRVAVLGPNGAGKSTMIKVLTGEVEPTVGEVYKHPNLRVAYVAQHAFHHLEEHLDKTPSEYIRWRYELGEDRELTSKVSRQLTEEDQKRLETPFIIETKKFYLENLVGRRKLKRIEEYEVKWMNLPWSANTWMNRDKLEAHGLAKVLQAYDDREAARAGLYHRPLTIANVQKHLQDVGLEPEFCTHSRIRGLSGGQKVKVVIGAAMWDNPHVLVLDEPTNYLDRDSLGALAQAIREYKGGVVMISHHSQFTDALCVETWAMDNGKLSLYKGKELQAEKLEMKEQTHTLDSFNNVVKVKSTKTYSRKELKDRQRRRQLKIKNGEPLSSDDEDLE